ncbi:1889_t:CDS:1, partial [Acaulospora colombiana]
TRSFKSPFELFYGKTPSVKHLRTWGCLAYVHLQKDQRHGTFGARAKRCIFLRYAEEAKGWVFWDTEKRSEFVSDSAVFYESIFPGTITGTLPRVDNFNPESHLLPDNDLIPLIQEPRDLRPTSSDPAIDPTNVPLPSSPVLPSPPINLPPDSRITHSVPDPNTSDSPPFPPNLDLESQSDIIEPQIMLHLPRRPQRELEQEQDQPSQSPPMCREVRSLLDTRHFERREEVTSRLRHNRNHSTPEQASTAISLINPSSTISSHYKPTIFQRKTPKSNDSHPLNPNSTHDMNITIPLLAAVDLALNISDSIEPKSLAEASERPDGDKYINAAIKEIEAHLENGTWCLTQLPEGHKAIGSRWVFKIKRDADGKIERYKARLVAKGYAQREGIDFTDTFAPTARFAALRTIIAKAAQEDWLLHSVDISTAFLNGSIDADVFMEVPEGLYVDSPKGQKWVLQLLKGLYGIKQGPRIWAKKLHSILADMGFARLECDHSVFIYDPNGVRVVVPVHVDDLIIAAKSQSVIRKFISQLSLRFKLRDQGAISSFLGIKLEQDFDNHSISLSQPSYIDSIIKEFLNIEPTAHFNP